MQAVPLIFAEMAQLTRLRASKQLSKPLHVVTSACRSFTSPRSVVLSIPLPSACRVTFAVAEPAPATPDRRLTSLRESHICFTAQLVRAGFSGAAAGRVGGNRFCYVKRLHRRRSVSTPIPHSSILATLARHPRSLRTATQPPLQPVARFRSNAPQ